jgi:hypothetical protein
MAAAVAEDASKPNIEKLRPEQPGRQQGGSPHDPVVGDIETTGLAQIKAGHRHEVDTPHTIAILPQHHPVEEPGQPQLATAMTTIT